MKAQERILTESQLDDEHWDADKNSRLCYEVAIAELRKEFLEDKRISLIEKTNGEESNKTKLQAN